MFRDKEKFNQNNAGVARRKKITPAPSAVRTGILVAALFVICWTGQAWSASSSAVPGGASKPPMVLVSPVLKQEVNPPKEYLGRVEAVQQVDIRARVDGFLEKVHFKEGSYVKEGDLLYEIEDDAYKAQVAVDKASAAKEKANLTKAEQYLARLKSVTTGGVSAYDVETAVSDQLQAKAALQEAEAVLSQSNLNLGYTIIKAPISGRIGATAYTSGNLVGPSDTAAMARIVQENPIRVVFSFSETELPEILKENKQKTEKERIFKLRLANGDMYDHTGTLDFVDNTVDQDTGTIAVRILFKNPEGALMPGQFVAVLDTARQGESMPVVSQAAVMEDKEGRYVYVVDESNHVVKRRITTGPAVGTGWAVESGLLSGEMVIVQGVQKVRPGQEVSPSSEGAR